MKTLWLVSTKKVLESVGTAEMGRARTVLQYDAMKLIVSVQGVLNRKEPTIYLDWEPQDLFWLGYMTRPGKFMNGYETAPIDSFDAFLDVFGKTVKELGIVAWDPAVPATMNAATTVCGVEDLLPIRCSEDGILPYVLKKTGAEVKLDLVGKFTGNGIIPDTSRPSSGSKKCDAYLWALEKYFDRTNRNILFYTIDGISWSDSEPYYPDLGNAFVYNHDYAIAKRCFVFDVSSYDDETPCDDPDQPLGTDYRTMIEIFRRAYDRVGGKEMITVCGFNPWQLKYTTHGGKGKHGGVDAEWRFTEVLSAYNMIKDADAYGYCGIANASVYTKYPLKEKYHNPRPKDKPSFDPDTTYVLFYVGDYDAAAWTSRFIPRWSKDPKLGKNPLMWCFNMNLSDRIPQAFDFIYENFTENDYFEAGDSGAGYNNPRLLYPPRVHSDLPSGVDVWVEHNKKYFEKFDNHCIGFIIDGTSLTTDQEMKDVARFADVGVGYLSLGHKLPTKVVDGTVFIPHTSDIGVEHVDPEKAADTVVRCITHSPENKNFYIFRTILVSPSSHDAIIEKVKEKMPDRKFCFADPYTFFRLAKEAKEKNLIF